MKRPFAPCRLAVLLCGIAALIGCESTKSATTAGSSKKQDQPAAPVGNPVAAYNVVSKELERDPNNQKLKDARRQYGTRTVDQLMAERENIPETNLSVREQILLEAAGYASERSAEVNEALASLRSIRTEILEAYATPANPNTVTEALERCAPYAKYAHTDVEIREALLGSTFVAGLESEMRKRATAGHFEAIGELQLLIADAGYGGLLSDRMDAAVQDGTRDYLRQQLDQRFASTTALPGERAIWTTLLGDATPRLKLGLLITGAEDAEVPNQINEDIAAHLGMTFAIANIDATTLPAQPDEDVYLVVDVDQKDVSTTERVEDRPSEYIKSYEDVRNPEYEAAFQEWSIARTVLDTQQDQYELQLREWEEQKENLDSLRLIDPTLDGPAEEGEVVDNELTPIEEETRAKFYLPPPHPPSTTRHALATRRLQNPPRKVRQPVYEEYSYSARIIDAHFEAVADLETFDRLSSSTQTADDVTHTHDRTWTQTTGVHVRDTKQSRGDLAENSLEFEKEIFLDGFASTCADQARDLLSSRALDLLRTALSEQQSASLTFGLAMYAAAHVTTSFELSPAEIVSFAESFSRINPKSNEWRVAGLAHIIQKGRLESTTPLDAVARLMASPSTHSLPATSSPVDLLRQHIRN